MSEQRVTTLVVEVAGRKSNLEGILQALQRDMTQAAAGARSAEQAIGQGLGQGSAKAAQELLKTAQAAQKVATEEQKTAQAAAKAAQEQVKVAAAQAKAAAEGAKLAVAEQRVAQSEQQAALAGQRLATEAQRTAAAQARAEQAAVRLAQAQQRGASGSTGWTAQVKTAAGSVDQLVGTLQGLGGAFAVVGAAQGAFSFAEQGGRIDAAARSFDNLAASAGTSGAALLRSLQQSASGTVANTDIIKSSNTALLLLGSGVATQLPQLLAVAKASASTLGTDVGQVFDSLVTGISRGSTELIDNAGITLKAGDAYAAYAAQLGKSADALTASEKQQALLNGVLTAGQQIIDQTSGGAEASGVSFQRFNASVGNLTATLQTAAAQGAAPFVGWLGQLAQASSDGITSLTSYGSQLDALNQRILGGAGGYEAYRAQVTQTNQQIQAGYGIFGIFAQTIAPMSQGAYALRDSLIASGQGADQATLAAQQYDATLQAIAQTQNVAGLTMGEASAQYTAVAAAAQGALAANAELAPGIQGIVEAYNAHNITAAEAQAQLTALAGQHQAEAQAAAQSAEAQAALTGMTQASTTATVDAAAAANTAAMARLEEAAAAAQTEQAHAGLEAAIMAAAAAGGSAEAAAARIASQFAGVELPQVIKLINAHRELAAARAGASSGGTLSADAASAMSGYDAGTVAKQRVAAAQAAYAERKAAEAEKAAARTSSGSRSGGGGGGGGGGGTAAPKLTAQQKLNNSLQQDQFKADQQRQKADQDHYQKLIDIQKDYAEASLAAQQSLNVSSRKSKYDFYKELMGAEGDVPKGIADGLSAQYEAAFAEAQRLSQEGKAKLGADYLAMKQDQLGAELDYQKELAAAEEAKDKGKVARLQALNKLRLDAEQADMSALMSGGDANVTKRDQALTGEDQRYAEAQDKIGGAAEGAAQRKVLAAQLSGQAIDTETAALQRQADLYAQMGKAPGAASTAPAAGAGGGSTTPAAPASTTPATGQGGPMAVSDGALLAALSGGLDALTKQLGDLKRAVDGLKSRTTFTTG